MDHRQRDFAFFEGGGITKQQLCYIHSIPNELDFFKEELYSLRRKLPLSQQMDHRQRDFAFFEGGGITKQQWCYIQRSGIQQLAAVHDRKKAVLEGDLRCLIIQNTKGSTLGISCYTHASFTP